MKVYLLWNCKDDDKYVETIFKTLEDAKKCLKDKIDDIDTQCQLYGGEDFFYKIEVIKVAE